MASYDYGKAEILTWVRERFPEGATALDVGACDGKWAELLGDYLIMDACEAWLPNIEQHQLAGKYRRVHWGDIAGWEYDNYDLVIFGDVLEHMTVGRAQNALDYAKEHSRDVLVAVPYKYPQDAIYGNPYERHIQDDLTPEIMAERYPGLALIFECEGRYGYYHSKEGDENNGHQDRREGEGVAQTIPEQPEEK